LSLGEQDGSDLLEGPDERGGISPVPGSNRVKQTPFGLRGALCCDGRTVNRRTVSLSDKRSRVTAGVMRTGARIANPVWP
jgi:hypothetical protein